MADEEPLSTASEEEVDLPKHLDLAELLGTPPTRTQSRRLQGFGMHKPNLTYSSVRDGGTSHHCVLPILRGSFKSLHWLMEP